MRTVDQIIAELREPVMRSDELTMKLHEEAADALEVLLARAELADRDPPASPRKPNPPAPKAGELARELALGDIVVGSPVDLSELADRVPCDTSIALGALLHLQREGKCTVVNTWFARSASGRVVKLEERTFNQGPPRLGWWGKLRRNLEIGDCTLTTVARPLMCPETGKFHEFTHDEEYDAGSGGAKTFNCENCGEPAPEGFKPPREG